MPPKNARILPFLTNLTVCFVCAINISMGTYEYFYWGIRKDLVRNAFLPGAVQGDFSPVSGTLRGLFFLWFQKFFAITILFTGEGRIIVREKGTIQPHRKTENSKGGHTYQLDDNL